MSCIGVQLDVGGWSSCLCSCRTSMPGRCHYVAIYRQLDCSILACLTISVDVTCDVSMRLLVFILHPSFLFYILGILYFWSRLPLTNPTLTANDPSFHSVTLSRSDCHWLPKWLRLVASRLWNAFEARRSQTTGAHHHHLLSMSQRTIDEMKSRQWRELAARLPILIEAEYSSVKFNPLGGERYDKDW